MAPMIWSEIKDLTSLKGGTLFVPKPHPRRLESALCPSHLEVRGDSGEGMRGILGEV